MAKTASTKTSSVNKTVKLDPNGPLRAIEFRKRLASQNLKRWDIYVSESLKDQVGEISLAEKLTMGVAAEALLALGVDAYLAGYVLPNGPMESQQTQSTNDDRQSTADANTVSPRHRFKLHAIDQLRPSVDSHITTLVSESATDTSSVVLNSDLTSTAIAVNPENVIQNAEPSIYGIKASDFKNFFENNEKRKTQYKRK